MSYSFQFLLNSNGIENDQSDFHAIFKIYKILLILE